MREEDRKVAQRKLEMSRMNYIDDIMDTISDTLDDKLLPAVSDCRAHNVAYTVDELSSLFTTVSQPLDQSVRFVDMRDRNQRFENLQKTYQQLMTEFGNECECTKKY